MNRFNKEMTVAAAQSLHPRAKEAFGGFHLGGCSHCAISEYETIDQVCSGYGVPVEMLLATLESLFEEPNIETKEAIIELESGKSEKFVDTNALLKDLESKSE